MARRKSMFGSRRKTKGFFGYLLEAQRRTEKCNIPGSKRKYKSKIK